MPHRKARARPVPGRPRRAGPGHLRGSGTSRSRARSSWPTSAGPVSGQGPAGRSSRSATMVSWQNTSMRSSTSAANTWPW
jgi:hypothetical protein